MESHSNRVPKAEVSFDFAKNDMKDICTSIFSRFVVQPFQIIDRRSREMGQREVFQVRTHERNQSLG